MVLPWGGWEGGQKRFSSSLLLYKKVDGAGGGAAVNALLKDRPPAAAASQPIPSKRPYTPASPSPPVALTQQARHSLSLAHNSSGLQLVT